MQMMGDLTVKKISSCTVIYLLLILVLTPVPLAHGIRLVDVTLLFEITDQLSQPSDVAVSKDGRIYVVDGVNNKIRIFNQSGQPLASLGKAGSAKGELKNPLGIDIDRSGNVYIADSGNHRVQIFDSNGDFIAILSSPSKTKHPADPTDVVVDETRKRCFVVDNDNHSILVYDLSTRKLIATYGAPGTDKRQFRYPFLLALDKDQYIYVVDVINTRVQVLNPEGLFVTFIGGWGVEKGEFFRPKGVSIDKNNRVYVSDSWMGVIQVFEPTGAFYAALGDRPTGKVKRFKTPVGLFIDSQNKLYVVEMFANKVSVYRLGAEFQSR